MHKRVYEMMKREGFTVSLRGPYGVLEPTRGGQRYAGNGCRTTSNALQFSTPRRTVGKIGAT
jgi:hypothetical protein